MSRSNGKHTLFWRGNLQNDNEPTAPAFPGQPPETSTLTNNKGFAAGYTAIFTSNLINNFRYGFTRQGVDDAGISNQPHVILAAVAEPQAFTRSTSASFPCRTLWMMCHGRSARHNFQFGGNIRLIDDRRDSNANSFPDGQMNQGWLSNGSTVANSGGPFDPPVYGLSGGGFFQLWQRIQQRAAGLVGIMTEGDAIYNYDKQGNPLAVGAPVKRDYGWKESEFYLQDRGRRART
jgi:hypothetical protein